MTKPKPPSCPGCERDTDKRGGLCAYCRMAVINMRPMRAQWNSNEGLNDIRRLIEKWQIEGLSPNDVDQMAATFNELDRQLSSGGWLPDEWDPDDASQRDGWEETPIPRGVDTINSELL